MSFVIAHWLWFAIGTAVIVAIRFSGHIVRSDVNDLTETVDIDWDDLDA